MMRSVFRKMLWLVVVSLCAVTSTAQNWPSFRGENGSGTVDAQPLPTKWEASNVGWRTPIPGLAHSSPVVWGDRVFITTAVSLNADAAFKTQTDDNDPVIENARYSWRIYCLNRKTGRVQWERVAHEGVPRVKRHLKASQSNSTPVTDGQYVVTIFASEGLFCYDTEGRRLWKQDLGVLDPGLHDDPAVQWGYASSPIIWKDLAIVQCDGHAQSFLAAFDLKSGRRVWSAPRGELPSWSSPVVYRGRTRDELITSAPKFIRAYDPLTGRELWRFANSDLIVQVPSPFIADDLIYLTGGWPGGRPIKVLKPGASGDISIKDEQRSGPYLAWYAERGGPYVPTPIVYGDYLYVCGDRGVLTCFNAKTGAQLYQQRINNQSIGFSASPVAGDGKIFLASEDGDVYVIKAGPVYELMAVNPMREAMIATPAISGGMLIVRGQHHVFGIGGR
ncbi:MAG TPA: PQQ-binding-like beta-propeller repeat protein [Blastocatellia bacterium]|nr:PQQ-binding-like beta-propeller repeat protein [Blastocatellia bacterium]